jgi:hypothetical protein
VNLDKNTVLLYAAKNYQNPHCSSLNDFDQDVKRFIIARTIIRNFKKGKRVKIRLLLNHIIICANMFGNEAAGYLLIYYCEKELWPYLAAIFDFLQITPLDFNTIPDESMKDILSNDIKKQ